ncbi:MAG: hypothetical protein LBL06_04845 [Treponema sp.]|nr:hypothetical protein [Treponema sp.]
MVSDTAGQSSLAMVSDTAPAEQPSPVVVSACWATKPCRSVRHAGVGGVQTGGWRKTVLVREPKTEGAPHGRLFASLRLWKDAPPSYL